MEKRLIEAKLNESHLELIHFVLGLNKADFEKNTAEKWSAGQELEHIYLSVKALRRFLRFPKFILQFLLGKSNRPSKSYDELVKKYLQRIASIDGGPKAPPPFVPKSVTQQRGIELKSMLQNELKLLIEKLNQFSEQELDLYIMPHPALGKLTLREMYYFTIYHSIHHLTNAKRNLALV